MIITNIQRCALHDGPGARTTFFLQGCNLHCKWCHNPETISLQEKLLFYENRCVGCGSCVQVCPAGALRWRKTDAAAANPQNRPIPHPQIDYVKCRECFQCVNVCPGNALKKSGFSMTVEEAFRAAERDRLFYESSGGGVTLSGGEPMMQLAEVRELLKRLREAGIHTALDTAGCQSFERYEQVLPWTDLFLVDYKLFSAEKHREFTGVDNGLIRENLQKLVQNGADIWVRIPVIPGVNDEEKELSQIAEDLVRMRFQGAVELLPFHRLGAGKYEALGRKYDFADADPPEEERMKVFRTIFKNVGLQVRE